MKNITIGIDYSQIRRAVYAESACVALMTGGNRPQIITEDNENLVNLYIDTAIVETVTSLMGFVEKGIDFGTFPIKEVPFIIPDGLQSVVLRKLFEHAIVSKVLEIIYEKDSVLTMAYSKRFNYLINKAKQLFAKP